MSVEVGVVVVAGALVVGLIVWFVRAVEHHKRTCPVCRAARDGFDIPSDGDE